MNTLAVSALLVLAAALPAMTQFRPFYAGGGLVYPRPFNTGSGGDSNDSDNTAGNTDADLGNRFASGSAPAAASPDRFGFDTQLMNDAQNYPRDRQPFWLLNRDHVLRHLGLDPSAQAAQDGSAPAAAAAAAAAAAPADAAAAPAAAAPASAVRNPAENSA